MLVTLIWGFANDVTTVEKSKRIYGLYGLGLNIAGIFSGLVGGMIAKNVGEGKAWDTTITYLIMVVLACGFASMVIHKGLHLFVFKDRNANAAASIAKKGSKQMTFIQTLRYIGRSRYLLSIAAIILSYNIVVNLSEFLVKSQIKELYPTPGGYTAYISKLTTYIGIGSTLSCYFLSGNTIRHLGWKFAALVTPILEIVVLSGFFYFLFLKEAAQGEAIAPLVLGMTPLAVVVLFGSLQNVLSRTAKYTFLDETKEMSMIPLDADTRLKGKAAIDGVGSRLGKSGGALAIQCFLMFCGSAIACAPYIAIVMGVVLFVWVFATNSLGKQFLALTSKSTASASEKAESYAVEPKEVFSN